ncbi:MAG: hypothetical protein WCF57_13790 [Pyrinomonadaceae bacterium]
MPSTIARKPLFSAASILLLLFAFALRVEYEYTFFPYQFDNGAQINAARSYANHQGLKECAVKSQDISRVVCEEQTWWAIGVPVLLSYADKITGDLLQAEFLLRCFGLLVLFVSIFFIYKLLLEEVSVLSFYLFCIFYAFQFTLYQGLTFTSDLLALAFFMAACCCSFYLIFTRQKLLTRLLLGLLCGFLLFLTGFMRYAYYTSIPIVPFSMLLVSLLKRRRSLLAPIVMICLAVLLFFALTQLIYPGHFAANTYFREKTNGFFPENLLSFDPFIFKSFVSWDLFVSRAENLGRAAFLLVNLVVWIISLVLLYPLAASSYRDFRRLSTEELRPTAYLKILTWGSLFSIVLVLSHLSVRSPKMYEEDPWTYVATTRYFLPFIVLFQINIFNYVASLKRLRPFSLKTVVALFLCAAFLLQLTIWVALRYKAYIKHNSTSAFAYRVETQEKVNRLVDSLSRTENRPVVLVGHYGTEPLDGRTSYLFANDFYMNADRVKASEPTILLLRLPKKLKQLEKDFIASHDGQKLLEFQDTDLYRTDVKP